VQRLTQADRCVAQPGVGNGTTTALLKVAINVRITSSGYSAT
jgi:hypothetical protein